MRTFFRRFVIAGVTVFTLRRVVLLAAALAPPRRLGDTAALPSVTVVVAARNEDAVVPRLLAALERLDYPADRLSFVLVCDGCTDGTVDALNRWAAARPRARVLELPTGRGKAAALNEALAASDGEVVVVADADLAPRPDFLRQLTPALTDQRVAAAAAYLRPGNADESLVARYAGVTALVHQLVTSAGKDRLGLNPPTFGAAAYRRSALEAVGGFPSVAVGEDLKLSANLAREGWQTRFVRDAVAENMVAADFTEYWHQHVRWARSGFASSPRPTTPYRGTLPQRIETWATALGYGDRVVFAAATAGACTGAVSPWVPAVYLSAPAAEIVAAVLKGRLSRRLPRLFFATALLFPADVAASLVAVVVHAARRPYRWESPRRLKPSS